MDNLAFVLLASLAIALAFRAARFYRIGSLFVYISAVISLALLIREPLTWRSVFYGSTAFLTTLVCLRPHGWKLLCACVATSVIGAALANLAPYFAFIAAFSPAWVAREWVVLAGMLLAAIGAGFAAGNKAIAFAGIGLWCAIPEQFGYLAWVVFGFVILTVVVFIVAEKSTWDTCKKERLGLTN